MRVNLAFLLLLILVPLAAQAQRFPRSVDTIAALAAINPNDVNTNALVVSYATLGDEGGGLFTWLRGSTASTNLGTVIASTYPGGTGGRWARNYSGSVSPCWFGADRTGTVDSTVPLQAALNVGRGVFIPNGTFLANSLDIPNGTTIRGESWGAVIKNLSGSVFPMLGLQSDPTLKANISIQNLTLDGNKANCTLGSTIVLSGTNLTVLHCLIRDSVDNGVNFGYSPAAGGYRILDNFFLNCGKAGRFFGAIGLVGGEGSLIQGNQIISTDGGAHYGIDIEPNLFALPATIGDIIVSQNTIVGGIVEITCTDATNGVRRVIFENNIVDARGAADNGFPNMMPLFLRQFSDFRISGNILYQHDTANIPYNGIYCYNLANGYIGENTLFVHDTGRFDQQGIAFDPTGPSHDIQVFDNRVTSTLGSIDIGFNAPSNSATNVFFSRNTSQGVDVLQMIDGVAVYDWANNTSFTNFTGMAGYVTNLLHVGSQAPNTGIIVGSQTAIMSTFGQGNDLEIYANGNNFMTPSARHNTDTNTGAGLQDQFILYNTGQTGVRAGVVRVGKQSAFTPGTETSYFQLRTVSNAVEVPTLYSDYGNLISYGADLSGPLRYSLDGLTKASFLTYGTGSPETIVTASPGSLYVNLGGGASTSLYVKESGTGNTGWIAYGTGGGGGGGGATNAITAINGRTNSTQFIVTGAAGTDFVVHTTNDTHTLDLPIASATVTGKLSSNNWATFNNKPAINATDGFIPYRSSATTLADSPLKRESVSQVSDNYRVANEFGPTFVFLKQGRTGSATNTPVAGAQLGVIGAGGWRGDLDVYNQPIQFIATENWAPSANGMKTEFWTDANGTGTQTLAMYADQDASVKVNQLYNNTLVTTNYVRRGLTNISTGSVNYSANGPGTTLWTNNASTTISLLSVPTTGVQMFSFLTLGDGVSTNGFVCGTHTIEWQTTQLNTPASSVWTSYDFWQVGTKLLAYANVTGGGGGSAFTTGNGVTNIANVVSANLLAGTNTVLTTNSYGVIQINSSGAATTAVGVTNNAGTLSWNAAAGANITFTTNAYGAVSISSTGGSSTNGLTYYQTVGTGTDFNYLTAADLYQKINFGTTGPTFVITNAGTYQVLLTVATMNADTFPQTLYLTNVTDSVLVQGPFRGYNTSPTDEAWPVVFSFQITTTGANRTIELWGKTSDSTYANAGIIASKTRLNVICLSCAGGGGSSTFTDLTVTGTLTVGTINIDTLYLTNLVSRALITNGVADQLVWNDSSTGLLSSLGIGSGLARVGTNLTATGTGGGAPTNTLVSLSTPATANGVAYSSGTVGTNAAFATGVTITGGTDLLLGATNVAGSIAGKQPIDADLTAISALTGTGFLARTGAGTYAERTLQQGLNMIYVNADGVAGDPTLGTVANPTFATVTATNGLKMTAGAVPSTPTSGIVLYADTTNHFGWVGTNGFTRIFDGTANTANRIYTLPDKNGTVAMTSDITGGTAGTMINTTTPTLYDLYRAKDTTTTNAEPSTIIANGTSLQLGHNAATPTAQLIIGNAPTGANTAGANLTIAAPSGTGTGAGGTINFSTAGPGSSGSTTNALSTKWYIDYAGNLVSTGGPITDSTLSAGIRPAYGLYLGSTLPLVWTSTGNIFGTEDTFIYRAAAATIQLGASSSTPISQTLKATDGVGTDIAAGRLSLEGGVSTGTGAGGNVVLQTNPSAKTTGSSPGTPLDRVIVVAKGKALTDAAAVSLFEVALPTLKGCGGFITATIECTDGTDVQRYSQNIQFTAANKGGAYTTNIRPVTSGVAGADDGSKSLTAGTLTAAWTILNGTNKITVQLNADTSLTPSTLSFLVYYTVTNNSEQAITIL